jgi:hypothetical protein
VGKQRDAMENNMKSPRLGISIDLSTDTPSSKITNNLFSSAKVSEEARGALNNLSINEHATRRGLSNLSLSVDHASL